MEQEQKKFPLKLWITVGAVVLAVILAVVLIMKNRDERKDSDWATVIPGNSQQGETLQGQETDPTVVTDSNGEQVQNSETYTESTMSVAGETYGENTGTIPTLGDEDPYEQCLVSAMIVGISMQYSDYEFLGIYTASETPISSHESSSGAYVIFQADGEKRALKAVPLTGERAERGTADIYVATLGYATYELIDPESVPVASLKEHKLEDLVDLISAYSLVSIIER